jgi:4-hydroxybenzoate polyprenyltransferase
VSVVAIAAGGDLGTAVRLGVAMTALQASIGALNDIVDTERDAGRKPGKPIPAGLVSARLAMAVVLGGGGVGLALSAPSGNATAILAIVVLAIGYAYDLVFKGTAWSWLPFAVGIPVLPVYGWLGAAGGLPGSFAVLLPVAVMAGSALAVANARADQERDSAAGVDSVAIRLGADRAWTVHSILLGVVVASAIITLALWGASAGSVGLVVGAGLVVAIGVWLGRVGDAARRERAWEVEAVGVGLLAVAWLAGSRLGG